MAYVAQPQPTGIAYRPPSTYDPNMVYQYQHGGPYPPSPTITRHSGHSQYPPLATYVPPNQGFQPLQQPPQEEQAIIASPAPAPYSPNSAGHVPYPSENGQIEPQHSPTLQTQNSPASQSPQPSPVLQLQNVDYSTHTSATPSQNIPVESPQQQVKNGEQVTAQSAIHPVPYSPGPPQQPETTLTPTPQDQSPQQGDKVPSDTHM
ncbi:hypothetical protein BGX34_000603 [Mortierella sp. NVP85]|nr:hypothetical protein BGX34_000603 [Mortierella sp. NVP85]